MFAPPNGYGATIDVLDAPGIPGGKVLQISADPNEWNDLTVTADPAFPRYTIEERGTVRKPNAAPFDATLFIPFLRAANVCTPSADSRTVQCDASSTLRPGFVRIEAILGDGNDTFHLFGSTPGLVQGGPGADDISGGDGADDLSGLGGDDKLSGGEGNDTLRSDGETPDISQRDPGTLSGDEGDDLLIGTNGSEILDGGPGTDEIRAWGGDDAIDGGDGNDMLNGGDGADTIAGGAGDDRLGTFLNLSPGNKSFERGDDTLDGGPGNDLLRPGSGPEPPGCADNADCSDNDILHGREGFDTVEYQRRTEPVTVSIDGLANDGQPGEADNVEGDTEKIIGSAGNDTLVGSPADDTIDGGGGDDLIDGLGGSDTLEGGTEDGGSDHLIGDSGGDNLSGSAGDDLIDGGDGADSASGGEGADVLSGGSGDDHVVGGAGTDTIEGEAGSDTLEGGDGADTLDGGEDNDVLRGDQADDVLVGGPGGDDFSGGDGVDVADYGLTAKAITVTLDNKPNDGEPREGDNVRSDVEDVEGGGSPDNVFGNAQGNVLDGASGEDYVDGGGGRDYLRGGGARDVVRARDGNPDVVRCGRSVDFAIVDPIDDVRGGDCERRSDGVHDRAQRGEDVIVEDVQGSNQFGLPGMSRTVPLQDRIEIPVRSSVDTTNGRVSLTSQANRKQRQSADFYGGQFQVDQQNDESLTSIHLEGGGSCTGTGAGPVRPSRRQHTAGVWGNTAGKKGKRSARSSTRRRPARASAGAGDRFRTVGAFSSATVSSSGTTVWFTQDRCNGTLTRVTSGAVEVRDFRRNKTVTLTAGERFLAPAP